MDNLFYRKDRKKFDLRAIGARLRKNKKAFLGALLGIPVVFVLLFGHHGIVQRIRLQNQRAEMDAKIHQAEAETKQLQAESRALDSDRKAIEKVAREKYGMARGGEAVYKVRKKN